MSTQRHYHIMDRKDNKMYMLAKVERNCYYREYIKRHENDIYINFTRIIWW